MTGPGFGTSTIPGVSVEIPGYRLVRQVGSDAVGFWIEAEQESLDRTVIVKLLKPEYAAHAGARREFVAEMERLTGLEHPHLMRVLDMRRDEPLALITQRIGRTTLATRLEEGALPLDDALTCMLGIAEALAFLTSKGFAHKNVMPKMIGIGEEGASRLATFRNVISFEALQALKGKLAQDPAYVAPEQVGGPHEVGDRTPVYHVGALLYHAIGGRPPHAEETPSKTALAHLREDFPSLKAARPFQSQALYDFVAACTTRNPADRPALAAVISGIEILLDGNDPGIQPPGDGRPAAPRPRRRRRRR
ncbi:MAG: protein kinase domain-containing protein [Planctomycetota bacterium]